MDRQQKSTSVTTLFVIARDDFDPDSLSGELSIKPTDVWRCRLGDVRHDHGIPQLEWRYESNRRPHASIDDAIQEIVKPFLIHRERIVSFAQRHKCTVTVVCRVYGDTSGIELCVENDTLQTLAGFQSSLCLTVDS